MLLARTPRAIAAATLVAAVLWGIAVVVGIQRIWSYTGTPGAQLSAPAAWPGSSLLKLDRGRATLLMFVHPLCACTRASLTELREALDGTDPASAVWIVLMSPRGIAPDWKTNIAAIAERIPEATIVTDVAGAEADKFGASTSGHVVVYDRAGKLSFSGGITGARGHVGDNDGRRGLVFALSGEGGYSHEHAVFGCGLDDPEPIQP